MTPPIDERFIPVADGEIFTWQAGNGPLLLFLHATSMCAGIYRDLLLPLAGQFRVVAADARGHGRTRLPLLDTLDTLDDWRPFRNDLHQLITALGTRPAVLAGHSFGATVLLELAADHPGLADHLLLIDPAFAPFASAEDLRARRRNGETLANPLAELADRRRPSFPDIETARHAYKGRGVFRGWPDSAFEAYLAGGLCPDGSGGVRLCCPPAWEARCYRGVSTTMEQSFSKLQTSFTLVAAGRDSPMNAYDEARIRKLHPEAVIARIEGAGHFLAVTHAPQVRSYFPA